MTYKDRITFLINRLANGKKSDFSELIGKGKSSISDIFSRGHGLSRKSLLTLAQKFQVNIHWVETGEGEPFITETHKMVIAHDADHYTAAGEVRSNSHEYAPQPNKDEFSYIPRYDTQSVQGQSLQLKHQQAVHYLAFRTDWLTLDLRVNPATLGLIEVMGDSMEPTLKNKDLILVDKAQRRIINGKLFVMQMEENLMVKRLEVLIDGRICVKSDNEKLYPPQLVSGSNVIEDQILGRVIWFAREM